MNPVEAANATAQAIGDLGGAFMTDGATYARGGELGFSGIDFYVLGRGGVLGDTSADVVAAAFYVWSPDQTRTQWASARAVMEPAPAAAEWASLCHAYGEANLPDAEGLPRIAELATKMIDAASPAGAALFAGWRELPVPGIDRPKARVQHQLNALRELRGGLHGGAVLAAGLLPQEAVAFRAPFMAPIFGWDPETLPEGGTVKEQWKIAEAGTDAAMGRVFAALSDNELTEFTELITALQAAVQAAKEA